MKTKSPNISRDGSCVVIPGMATAHSHAFQRALRGRTQRRPTSDSSFWSWRGLMYELAAKLDPDDIYNISRFAFVELALAGVTAVGEFHYVHHQPDGTPYDDRVILSDAVIRAARDAGLRITLIRTAYLRGGYQQAPMSGQKRFIDPLVEHVFHDIEKLKKRYKTDDQVHVAIAAHSIRAVPIEQVRELSDFARENKMPLHMHVSEQRRELAECKQEYGITPIALLNQHGVLSNNFVGIHATHISSDEIKMLGETQSYVCLCRTTERDLGDGLAPTAELINAGAEICVGVDSHAVSDAFEEMRAVELDERSRTEARTVAAEAPKLLDAATRAGFTAIGMKEKWHQDQVFLSAADPSIACVDDALLSDAVVFGATPRAVQRVTINGRVIVEDGRHVNYEAVLKGYEKTMQKLSL